ncbi:hypothetical protein DPMN_103535 [Dreissena polymorpha]|uniref:Uncharacterized protein n=1 Tax=Dreissena polymorpha TaxID=45954 RepID=A0A9D4H9Y3_DREPO|nr:hypothetical protein DPMN_103535 [Dreissena polymorpha]
MSTTTCTTVSNTCVNHHVYNCIHHVGQPPPLQLYTPRGSTTTCTTVSTTCVNHHVYNCLHDTYSEYFQRGVLPQASHQFLQALLTDSIAREVELDQSLVFLERTCKRLTSVQVETIPGEIKLL